jgi:hypothetical protein
MQRWQALTTALGALAATVLATTVLAGCGTPAGVDANLTDDWASITEPTPFLPRAGVCHLTSDRTGHLTSYTPLDCGKVHRAETVHIGTFSGTAANQSARPAAGSPAMRGAFTNCDTQTTRFLGAEWRGARLSIEVVPPSPQGWTGGSRWYRCDVIELDVLDGGTVRIRPDNHAIERTGSLRDALTKPSPLAYRCFTQDRWQNLIPIACTKRHRHEYAGVWTAPDTTYAEFEKQTDRTYHHCRSVIAAYVRIPDDGTMKYRTGTTFRPPSAEGWQRGDRGVRCFLWSSDKDLTRSLKQAGPSALPIN